jgi:hypothetical protein
MDHKNPVSGSGGGVLYLDILKKHAICLDYRFWQEIFNKAWHLKLLQCSAFRNFLTEMTNSSIYV